MGAGRTMVVEPPLTRYTMRRGREATVGSRTLTLQRKLSTSSAKPRNIMQQMDSSAQMNWENWKEGEREGERECYTGTKEDVLTHFPMIECLCFSHE